MNNEFPAGREMLKALPEWLAEKLESIGVSPKKAWEYAGMFLVLCPIYYFYLLRGYQQARCSPEVHITLTQLALAMIKFTLFSAWPFVVVAAYDGSWRSKDAGNVFLAAYAAALVLWMHKIGCGFCAFGAAAQAIPYIFCAWVAHGVGVWGRRWWRSD